MADPRLRILQIVADGTPGGGTTAVLGLCADLARAGDAAVTLVTDRGSYAAGQARAAGIAVRELDFFRSRFDPRIRAGLSRILAQAGAHVVHAHGARAALPLSLVRRRGEMRAYTVHGFHFTNKSPVARLFARAAERRIARRSDHVVFVSQADRQAAERARIRFPAATVIYNGIALDELGAERAGGPSHDLVFSARMHRQKNPLFMIELMRRLAGDGIRLAMVGGGDLEADARRAAAAAGLDRAIDFTGALPRDEAIARVRGGRLFVMPSLWEGLPIAPIEAMACGVPVVGSDIDGTREVVRDGETGLLVPGFDADRWAARIRAALADEPALAAMRAAGRADVRDRFTRERSSTAHRALYDALLRRGTHAA